ncbi:hypothetical protein GCM10023223_33740 [Stackebrandtia albiflava]
MGARLLVTAVAALAVLFFSPTAAQADDCSVQEWHENWRQCVDALPDEPETSCKTPPVPASPDSGMAGWFAQEPQSPPDGYELSPQAKGAYSHYGYAGYDMPLYDLGCVGNVVPDSESAGNSLANLEFTLATGIIGASNGLRHAAWEPGGLWGWADTFVKNATEAIYEQVFTVFGALTVALVGLYLIWRSRQADMSMAVTTAGWAVLVLVVVTAVARWPVESANFADEGLTASLSVVQDAVGPPTQEGCEDAYGMTEAEQRAAWDGGACLDLRSPATRASDMATGEILYNNWIRSVLGQSEEVVYETDADGDVLTDDQGRPVVADGNTAYKYGPALYDATAFTWAEIQDARASPSDRQMLVEQKQNQWRKVAAAIEREDPEAYQNLTGANGWDRAGTGLLAILSALFFALFDLTTSILIILGFLLIRWAVIALPLIGTIAILRPASGGFKRLVSAVVAAVINVIVFGVAAAVYLYAVSQILAADLPGWLQVLLIALIGVAAWMLLRPYRRLGSLRGGSSIAEAAFGRRRSAAGPNDRSTASERPEKYRVETGKEEPVPVRSESREPLTAQSRGDASDNAAAGLPPRPAPATPPAGKAKAGYAIYRPSGSGSGASAGDRPMVTVRRPD